MAFADHGVMVLMTFLIQAFLPRELAIKNSPGHDACMQTRSGGILFPVPQYVHEFVCGITVQDLIEETRFDPVFSLLARRRVEKLTWSVEGCLGWYHWGFQNGVVQGAPAYR